MQLRCMLYLEAADLDILSWTATVCYCVVAADSRLYDSWMSTSGSAVSGRTLQTPAMRDTGAWSGPPQPSRPLSVSQKP